MNPDQPNRRTPSTPAANPSASGAIIAVSIIAATAFAVYESPEVRQLAEHVRRQIALKLRQLGDNIDPADRRRQNADPFSEQPLFNRPEDAQDTGVDADAESKRRQEKELEYWNKLKAEQAAKKEAENPGSGERERRSFGDFLEKDNEGTYVYKSGTETAEASGLTQRRGVNTGAAFGNPFSDEHGIESESQDGAARLGASKADTTKSLITTDDADIKSDGLYSASERRAPAYDLTMSSSNNWQDANAEPTDDPIVAAGDPLIDISEPFNPSRPKNVSTDDDLETSAHLVRPGQDDAFAAIHAWNANASSSDLAASTSSGTANGFYSPLPETPRVQSEIGELGGSALLPEAQDGNEAWSDDEGGMATPKTMASMSVIGDAESLGDASEDGRHTPGSWTEVNSVVSGEEIRERS